MSKKIGIQQARALLAAAVATQGRDFVYNDCGNNSGCFNVPFTEKLRSSLGIMAVPEESNKRKTGCLVGTAMKLSGLCGDLTGYERGTVGVFEALLDELAEGYFGVAQRTQDCGSTWGAAQDAAEDWFKQRWAGDPSLHTVDLPEARHLLSQAVHTQGREFVYNPKGSAGGCFNVPITEEIAKNYALDGWTTDSPKSKTGCLVGTALALAGIPIASHSGPVSDFSQFLSETARRYLAVAQQMQDNAAAWGHAYDGAEAYANGFHQGRLSTLEDPIRSDAQTLNKTFYNNMPTYGGKVAA